MPETYNPTVSNRMVAPQITGVLAVFLKDGIEVNDANSAEYVTGPDQFPTPPTTPPTDPSKVAAPWVSFGFLGGYQPQAVKESTEVKRFHGGAFGYRTMKKETVTGMRMTFTTPDLSPEYFQLAFGLGNNPGNGESESAIGMGGDPKITGYMQIWLQNDVGDTYLAGLFHGNLRLTQTSENTTSVGNNQFEFELDYLGDYQLEVSNLQDITVAQ